MDTDYDPGHLFSGKNSNISRIHGTLDDRVPRDANSRVGRTYASKIFFLSFKFKFKQVFEHDIKVLSVARTTGICRNGFRNFNQTQTVTSNLKVHMGLNSYFSLL